MEAYTSSPSAFYQVWPIKDSERLEASTTDHLKDKYHRMVDI